MRRAHSPHRAAVLAERAVTMRVAPTLSEALLWQALRGSRLGVPFRRQVVLGDYIADFLAPRARLVVEVDGGFHREPARVRADARRDRDLGRMGYRVLRLPHALVVEQLEQALLLVVAALAEQQP